MTDMRLKIAHLKLEPHLQGELDNTSPHNFCKK